MFKNEEGFSLLELVVAVGVAGIIAAVALPTFAGLQDKATTTSATYAASASAAEALANSTIGGVSGTTSNNSSYTGGASSSSDNGVASSSSSTSAISTPANIVNSLLDTSVARMTSTNYGNNGPLFQIYHGDSTTHSLYMVDISAAKADAIYASLNAGTYTNVSVTGISYFSGMSNSASYAFGIASYSISDGNYPGGKTIVISLIGVQTQLTYFVTPLSGYQNREDINVVFN